MAQNNEKEAKNEVHENAIWIERITKETFNAKLTQNCNPNPRFNIMITV